MTELASHYESTQRRYPRERLMILFDIDGTILDMRCMILYVLQAYDRSRGNGFFQNLRISDITVHENTVDRLLARLPLRPEEREEVLSWYLEQRWTSAAILESHSAFRGALEVIRWFQIQPGTYVGLNTGRPEALRADTLRSLNKLGKDYRVSFTDELLHMNPAGWNEEVESTKVGGVLHFHREGYRIFAMVDNEPDNLKAVSKIDPQQEILLLHANTIFESKRTKMPRRTVSGKVYDLTDLIPEKSLPERIQFVWHGVNDKANLRQFLASDIHWAEFDIRTDPVSNDLILRHDSLENTPQQENEDRLILDDLLYRLHKTGKGIKLDLKGGGTLVDRVLDIVDAYSLDESCLWFNAKVERLRESGFRQLADAHPSAVLQCPVSFLAPLILSAPRKAKEILTMFTDWGINRFSISWLTPDIRQFFDQMDQWGFEVNIYDVPDLEAFLQAVLLMPRSITSDFNFPRWYYYGRGSGENGNYYEYSMR
ncbi:MAG: hypothetical protein BA861_10790 [Desulfobacterales bacterium S3730MH5]|nr:MAG: hypothetical protein BA861_10790 [Desulfobacterales bacterium S3730MH5]